MSEGKPALTWLSMVGVLLLFLSIDVRLAMAVLRAQPPGVDWAPLWAAARLPAAHADRLYDFAWITRAQAPLIGTISGLRPFVYPPSALPVFAPFARLPVLPSYIAWTALTGALYLVAASRLTGRWWTVPLMPPVVLAALTGQTGFLLGGMMMLGLEMLEKRPVRAGLLLGMATAIKPQLFLLVPVALIVARDWRALAGWGAGGAAMLLVSLLLFGAGAWLDWIAALPRFQVLFERSPTLVASAISPYALARRMGWPAAWVLASAAVPALAAVWNTFRRRGGVARRLIALVGGALLVSPYAMNYELAVLVPAIVAGARHSLRGMVLLLVVGLSVPFGFGCWGLLAAMLSLVGQRNAAPLSRR